ncbi:MAG: hypothetical protein IJ324_11885 [Lachnospiraceae bacterium]|nr:hypothetical protein [Lachnospiraceae bacterium]
MNKRVLYVKNSNIDCESLVQGLYNSGYVIVEYNKGKEEESIEQILNENFFYFVCSLGLDEEVYKACMGTATKYVVFFEAEQKASYEKLEQTGLSNCYFVLLSEENVGNIEKIVFVERELYVYHLISELDTLHKKNIEPTVGLKQLRDITDDAEVVRLTDVFFDNMELEKELTFLLKDRLLEYIDLLLMKKNRDSWREIVLWNRKHECVKLANCFWQFYLLQKAGAIYAEEMLEYYKSGEELFITKLGSFDELSGVYFQLLLLLRRLEYDVASDEDIYIVNYIMKHNISGIFIRHVIEQNKITNKEKVYNRLEELLVKYG